jgi:hypothetical protein
VIYIEKKFLMRRIMTLNEFVAASQTAPGKPETKPVVEPGIAPGTAPSRPSPIRREKPAVAPQPKAQAEDIVQRYLNALKGKKEKIGFSTKPIMQRYEGQK